jgi:peptidoglycan/LPS O-acetylase OafA/YrhL
VLAASLLRDKLVFGVDHGSATILANLTFVFNLWPGHEEGIAWASWTIGVEMLFYIIFPALAARASTIPTAAVAVLLSLLLALIYEAILHHLSLRSAQDQYGVIRAWFKPGLDGTASPRTKRRSW